MARFRRVGKQFILDGQQSGHDERIEQWSKFDGSHPNSIGNLLDVEGAIFQLRK